MNVTCVLGHACMHPAQKWAIAICKLTGLHEPLHSFAGKLHYKGVLHTH